MKIVKSLAFTAIALLSAVVATAQHGAGTKGKILMIVSNPAISEQTGWPIGVWASEVTHPYWKFTEAGYSVDFASPKGGEVKFDSFSDPRDESGYSAFDYISLGFINDSSKMALLQNTKKLADTDPNDYKAIFVCGGQAPMYTFVNDSELHQYFANFYSTGKPTAAICHGTSILLKTKLPGTDTYLVDGKKWTGFSSSEEQYADNYLGFKLQPFRIQDEAKKIENTNFIEGAPFSSFAVKDGNLITGQQQNSGAEAAQLVIQAIHEDRNRYPTYVLVHGAWADESAWGFVRNKLAEKANVEVVNLPGHGIDLSPKNEITLRNYVDQVKELVKKQPGKVKLVGHSMSGIVISQVAEEIPENIEKLIYVSAYLPENGQTLADLAQQDTESELGEALAYNSVKGEERLKFQREVAVPAVCEDCPDFMKEILVKYYTEEPLGPFQEPVSLSKSGFGKVPKYYIFTKNDKAVSHSLQQKMAKTVKLKGTYVMETSHLPFVVKPAEFIAILSEID